jgi:hypothetical protein
VDSEEKEVNESLEAERVELPLIWEDSHELPILTVNHFILQRVGGTEFVLGLGTLDPPLIAGTRAERQEQLKSVPYVPIRVVGRFGLSAGGVRGLARLLDQYVTMLDKSEGEDGDVDGA